MRAALQLIVATRDKRKVNNAAYSMSSVIWNVPLENKYNKTTRCEFVVSGIGL